MYRVHPGEIGLAPYKNFQNVLRPDLVTGRVHRGASGRCQGLLHGGSGLFGGRIYALIEGCAFITPVTASKISTDAQNNGRILEDRHAVISILARESLRLYTRKGGRGTIEIYARSPTGEH